MFLNTWTLSTSHLASFARKVELQVKAITDVATELRSFLDNLAARQREKAVSQFFHALKSGNKDDKKLQGILDQLDRARNELRLRISVAQVGLLGNLQDGFRVAFGVLEQTNTMVNKVLGINLALMDIVKNQTLQQTGQTVDGTITVNTDDVLAIGMPAPDDTASMNSSNEARETNAYGKVTLGHARIMTGNIGVEGWAVARRQLLTTSSATTSESSLVTWEGRRRGASTIPSGSEVVKSLCSSIAIRPSFSRRSM
ncbi:hypothetical protein V3481_018692 [Fusarium oxysporum f. sp. vasinfectum]